MWEKTIATTTLLIGMLVVSAQAQYAPTASVDSYNNPSITGETVTFDAGNSDPGMYSFMVIYEWYIDGQMVYEGYYNEFYQHTFTLPPGETSKDYTIRLRVVNDMGLYDDVTMIQTVEKEWQHYTHIKDHLGSVRSTIDKDGQVVSRDDYYPYGLPMPNGRSVENGNPENNRRFTSHQYDEDFGVDLTYAGARYLDPEIGVWMSVDPLAGKFPEWSPYNYTMGNPIRLVDPDGMAPDIYVFQDGKFTGNVIPQAGEHIGRVQNSDGSSYDFKFADPVHDPTAIDAGKITNLVTPSDSDIENTVNDSGVFSSEAQNSPIKYAINESRGGSGGSGSGKLDFTTEQVTINGSKSSIDKKSTLYLTRNKAGNVAHNGSNYGNFLWGAAMKALGISSGFSKLGAHADALWNHWERDTDDDQYSIEVGRQQVVKKNE